ncbi:hypothetical protein CDAR_47711 [Caerostris darwini]|uniref:Uncharacterized protein n=1 Tax=Caerostris darwini TaxID=1538125 RepID=A0AAV4M8G4_9ARAC|nr:hypothetical protein CDAR_47711 [Caerostris darwini]
MLVTAAKSLFFPSNQVCSVVFLSEHNKGSFLKEINFIFCRGPKLSVLGRPLQGSAPRLLFVCFLTYLPNKVLSSLRPLFARPAFLQSSLGSKYRH